MLIQKRRTALLPYEILALLEDTKSLAERIQIFQTHESYELKTLLQIAFHPGIKFLLPEGNPPYTPSPIPNGLQYSSLNQRTDILVESLRNNSASISSTVFKWIT